MSDSTLKNYARSLAKMALHFNCDPTTLSLEKVEDYLLYLKEKEAPSQSYFKHTIYGLRFAFRLQGKEALALKLPQLKRHKDLPVVLSQQEIKRLIASPKYLKHKLMLATLYGCGLRLSELQKLELKDLDFDRMQIHIRNSKYGKSRYVVMSSLLKRGLKKYIQSVAPIKYVFNGNQRDNSEAVSISSRGIQWVVRESTKTADIKKKVTTHTLRHSFATHLLEMGLDLVSIKEQLGHESVLTTMIYLKVARLNRTRAFSPLDKLYNL